MKRKCQYPVNVAPGVDDTCDAPAKYETDDLRAIHYLCAEHCAEAGEMNDFRRDEL